MRCLLGIGADPIDDAILVKIVLVSEGEVLAFTQLPHKDEGGAVKVVPLLRHLEHKKFRIKSTKTKDR